MSVIHFQADVLLLVTQIVILAIDLIHNRFNLDRLRSRKPHIWFHFHAATVNGKPQSGNDCIYNAAGEDVIAVADPPLKSHMIVKMYSLVRMKEASLPLVALMRCANAVRR